MTHSGDSETGFHKCAGCAEAAMATVGRRSFIGALLGAGSLAIGAILGTPLLRFVLYPVYAKSSSSTWSDVGEASEFDKSDAPTIKDITVVRRDGWREVVSSQSVYVNRSANGQLQVLSAICPHLGCSVAWQAKHGKFVCPCHGGQFAPDGQRISGPPPRGLDNLKAQVADGKLQVQFEYFRSNAPQQESLS